MEFASYHGLAGRKSAFGVFWPDRSVPSVTISLTGERLAKKFAAIAAYGSQAHILRKFPAWQVEPYRVAPVYDFRKPSPPPFCRWDMRSYQPSTAEWRAVIAETTRVLKVAA